MPKARATSLHRELLSIRVLPWLDLLSFRFISARHTGVFGMRAAMSARCGFRLRGAGGLQLEAPCGGVLLGLGVGVRASAGPRKSAMHGCGQ